MEPLQVLKVFPLGLLLCWAFNGAACAISAQAQGSPPASNMLLIGDGVIVHWNAREIALQKADGARIDVAELFGDATYKL